MTSESVRRALLSVHDKEGLIEFGQALASLGIEIVSKFGQALASLGIEIVSSGGTAGLLEKSGLRVVRVGEYTGFPEMLDGRVKTLHPRIHAGILAVRSNSQHVAQLAANAIEPIDLVVVNLYPFEKTAATAGVGLADVIEMIDIGGPSLVRAAAKNFAHVGVVVSPEDYAPVAEELKRDGGLSAKTRYRLAVKAFRHTSDYDSAVWAYLDRVDLDGERREGPSDLPARLQLEFVKTQELRYGENPHQRAAFYREPAPSPASVVTARQLQGKELSFNNILDFDAALALVLDFREGAAAIIKHGNPCGVAVAAEPHLAFQRALECDPKSAFGGVIAFNRQVDRNAAQAVAEQFYEGVIAPGFDADARRVLSEKKNLRLLELGPIGEPARQGFDLRRVAGGLLVQDWDRIAEDVRQCRVVTARSPSATEWQALEFAWIVAKHVKSNAIVYAHADRTIGIGAGQMSRVDSARFGIQKARVPLTGSVLASDAFFPFRDGLDVAAEAGVTAVVQPGGSVRDSEVVAAADEHGMAMVFTERRHFRH